MRLVILKEGVIAPVDLTRAERAAAARLAAAIAALARAREGVVTLPDLLEAGFDPEEIAAHHPHAVPRAARALGAAAFAAA